MRHSLDSKTVGTWQAPEFPFRIDWSVAVLAEIRIAAMDAFLSLPHGGLEIGGVLFGVRERDCVRILAARPLACEHALGPKFVLSTHDRERLRAVLEVGEGNLQPVGWYHSHTRGDLSLDTGDLEIHHSYFPAAWQVALVVRPHLMQPVRAGFFFRAADGSLAVECRAEFVLDPADAPEPAKPSPLAAKPLWGRLWWTSALVMLMMSGGLLTLSRPKAPASVSLTTCDRGGQLQIHWDHQAALVRAAESGEVEILDSTGRMVVLLNRRQLRNGSVNYARTAARVDVQFVLRGPSGATLITEAASFIGPLPAMDSCAAAKPQ